MSFRDRLSYAPDAGTYHDGAMRYMFIKPEAVMGILHALPPELRPTVMEAMAESVFVNGGKSAQTYKAQGAEAAQALLDVIRETSGQLGWGHWTLTLTGAALTVEVENSPFAEGFGPSDIPVCAPIRGMLRAVSGMIFGTPCEVTETACAAMGATRCTFIAKPKEV
ncbi:V4R domain-containing protein [Celeribacter persicus]|uniref:Putative hydrocarbon binding protein n=1 Tax=Celeribacter persicus TaxID=1651082 RepID=A0A2T5HUP9_9RHOB|nr:V4R domain-containing protein [Celeribacter persicus]PTQ75323.1 putative hydrocarbon binding protein [Celeribacter persicus]